MRRKIQALAPRRRLVTLEDETGYLNLVAWERLAERDRRALLGARLLGVVGVVRERAGRYT